MKWLALTKTNAVPELSSGAAITGSLSGLGILDNDRYVNHKSYNREYYMQQDYQAPIEDKRYVNTYTKDNNLGKPISYNYNVNTKKLSSFASENTVPLKRLSELDRYVKRELIKKV